MLNQLVATEIPIGHGLLLEGSQDVEQVGPARDNAAIYEEFRGRHGRHHSSGQRGGRFRMPVTDRWIVPQARPIGQGIAAGKWCCLLYTSDAADEEDSV